MSTLFLVNGRFHTQDPAYPDATAVAMRDGRIWAVGNDEEIRALVTPGQEVIDLEGRCVLPGLTDGHFHFYDWALGLRQLPLAAATSLEDLGTRLAQRTRETPAGDWILGQGWNETRWPEPRFPNRADLDQVAPDHPVILWRNDLHLAVANSLALQQANITADTLNPPEGVIDRDGSGQPTGVLRDLAINLVRDIIPPATEDETVDAMRAGFGVLHRVGLTGLHDYRIMGGADGPPSLRALQRLHASREIGLRIWTHIPGERLGEAIALGLRTGFGDNFMRVGHIKLFSDGGQGSRTAWMLEPYCDVGHCGMPLTPMNEIAEATRRADEAGLAVAVHAIGDRANRELVTMFEQVLKSKPQERRLTAPPAAPHRIEHVQNIRPEDVVRLARLGTVASVQPIHVTDDLPMTEQSVGERARFSYPFRDMWDAGVALVFGSDCPVANPNPFWGIHAAVTRQQRDGTPAGGWYPRQRLTVSEAVWAYSMGSALVTGREATQGSITPGKLADMVVLDRDIFIVEPMEIAEAQPVMTIFDGQVVYER